MGAVHHLCVDIETYSDVDIQKAGLYRYAQSPAFEVLLFAYSLDGAPVRVVDLTQTPYLPQEVLSHLFHPQTVKHAFNAAFEWYCLSRHFRLHENAGYPPEAWLGQWRCTQLHGLYCGYPRSLDALGRALDLPQQKLASGRSLITYFCKPCAPTKTNGGRVRNLPHHDPAKWVLFQEYCAQDVATEMAAEVALTQFPVPADVQAQWVTAQCINVRGVAVDTALVAAALELDGLAREESIREAVELTGLDNPNSVAQLRKWLARETEQEITDLRKDTVTKLLGRELDSDAARRVLELRQELSKSSTKKYQALAVATSEDGRARGLLQFYGANRTGRWAGRNVQPQNLPRTYLPLELLPLARALVKNRQAQGLRLVFGSVPHTLSQLIRTVLIPAPGCILVDADFSAIEARVLAWLAGEEWVLEVFRTHGRIYEATASQLYGVPMEKIVRGNPEYQLRQYGKAATLALGYGGGAKALITAGNLPEDTPETELLDLRDRWRQANPNIVNFWNLVDAAALEVLRTGRAVALSGGRVVIALEGDGRESLLTIRLPGGRKLYYVRPHPGVNQFGRECLCFWGVENNQWRATDTYGGKLTENMTQAVARDLLAEAVERLEAAGHKVVLHIHDEVVVESEHDTLAQVAELMSVVPPWAEGLPLRAEGWTGDFFRKD